MSQAEPERSSSQPQPPQRCSRPAESWPKAMLPVPLITTMPALLPWRSPWAPRRAVRSSPVTKTWGKGMASAAAARALPCSWMAVPCSMPLAPTAAAARSGCVPGPRAWAKAGCQRQRKTLRPPARRQMADPRTSALGHGEQASIAAQAGQSAGGVGLAGIEASQQGTCDRSAFSGCGHLTGAGRPGWPGRARRSVELPAGKRSCR